MRDGQQGLWGMRMTAGMALPVTPIIDRVGYRVVDLRDRPLDQPHPAEQKGGECNKRVDPDLRLSFEFAPNGLD